MRYSEKEAFNSCPQKFKYVLDGLKKSKDDRSVHHLTWGQAIHAGLEAHYKGADWATIQKAFLDIYPVDLDDADLAKTSKNGLEVLRRYIAFYKGQDDVWEVMDTEHAGLIEIGDEDHGLHIDLIARHRQTGEVYFWDHKTSQKEASVTYWKTYELSGQVSRYTDYVMQKFGSCAGCYINNMSVKFLKIKNKYGEGPGLVVKFERQLFNRTPEQLKFWRDSDEGWMKLMEFAKQTGVYPKALNTLCGWCEYYELCLSSGDSQIKELLYSKNQDINIEIQ
jgi:hypothetical protein